MAEDKSTDVASKAEGVTVAEKKCATTLVDDWEYSGENPRNWTTARKLTTMSVVSLYALLAPLGSSMMAPALVQVGTRYDITNDTILAMSLSIILLSSALGSLTLPPLSEIYGRKWVLHLSNVGTAVFSLVCAFVPNGGALIAFLFLAGYPGAGPISIGGGCVADLYREEERAGAMAVYTLYTPPIPLPERETG